MALEVLMELKEVAYNPLSRITKDHTCDGQDWNQASPEFKLVAPEKDVLISITRQMK
jgi:hypothetical protein